eukprot:5445958-Amphidinium_carterae.1
MPGPSRMASERSQVLCHLPQKQGMRKLRKAGERFLRQRSSKLPVTQTSDEGQKTIKDGKVDPLSAMS